MILAIQQRVHPIRFNLKYQPSGEGGARSPPATPHRLQNPKWPPGGPKMAEGVWKGVYPQVLGRSRQLSLNKFFDPSTPSMRKGRDGEKKKKKNGKKTGKKKKKKENTDENSGHYVIASSRPPERRPLERRMLAPILLRYLSIMLMLFNV